VATGGKCTSPEIGSNKPKPLRPVATVPIGDGKEGVDGSSPSEGFSFSACSAAFSVVSSGAADVVRCPPSVHRVDVGCLGGFVAVEQSDRMLCPEFCGASSPGRAMLRRGRSWQAGLRSNSGPEMRKDVREFSRRLEAVGLTVESTPGHYRVLRDGEPLRKANGMPFKLPFSPDTTRWRRAAIVELRKLGIHL
jgi:hypothetical protein